MSIGWPEMPDTAARRLTGATHAVVDALRGAAEAAARRGSAGAEQARALTGEMLARSQRAGRSLRTIIEEHPAESLLLVGAAAFALGWLLRRTREPQPAAPARRARRR